MLIGFWVVKAKMGKKKKRKVNDLKGEISKYVEKIIMVCMNP